MAEALREGSAGAVLALANLHPEPCVALAQAVREGRDDDVVRLQGELTAHDAQLRAAGGIPALKRAVAERVAGYSAEVRGPLAPAAPVAAAS
jgi:dihydrodipicolinate synthase/N-acetylneuraminate lyase